MGILKPLEESPGYLKAGLLGFAGSGKTHTAVEIALFTRQQFDLKGPIVMFDSETGSAYIKDWVQEATGLPLMGVRSKSFDDMLNAGKEAEKEGAAVYIVDSVTHPWREILDSYLAQVNRKRKARRLPPKTRLEFQDWNPIKSKWREWTDFFLSSQMHVIMCGRAGDVYEFVERDDEDGKRDLVKSGVKMATEKETGFEPSLLVEMQRVMDPATHKIAHKAVVLKDRFRTMTGLETLEPKGEWFTPHLSCLQGKEPIVIADPETEFDLDEKAEAAFKAERRRHDEILELITNEFTKSSLGQTKDDKKKKVEILEIAFKTSAWKRIETLKSDELADGLDIIKAELAELSKPKPKKEKK